MKKTMVVFYCDPSKYTKIKKMSTRYKRSYSSMLEEAVDVIIRNEKKLNEIYLGKEK